MMMKYEKCLFVALFSLLGVLNRFELFMLNRLVALHLSIYQFLIRLHETFNLYKRESYQNSGTGKSSFRLNRKLQYIIFRYHPCPSAYLTKEGLFKAYDSFMLSRYLYSLFNMAESLS